MPSLKVLIIDDDNTWHRRLSSSVTDIFRDKNIAVDIEASANAEDAISKINDSTKSWILIITDIVLDNGLYSEDPREAIQTWGDVVGAAYARKIPTIALTNREIPINNLHDIFVRYKLYELFVYKHDFRDGLPVKIDSILENSGLIQSKEISEEEREQFDVFFSYKRSDISFIRTIRNSLQKKELTVWIDEENIDPGEAFQRVIQKAIPSVKLGIVFLGQEIGQWQAFEIPALHTQHVERNMPLIPVLLPGVNEIPKDQLFLKELHYIEFSSLNDQEALNSLINAIQRKIN